MLSNSFNQGVGSSDEHQSRAIPISSPGAFSVAKMAGLVLLTLAVIIGLSGCATNRAGDVRDAKELAPTVEPLAEFLSRAQAADAADGGRERARMIYRDAAKAYPTDKRPWLRLAQSYFDLGDYGNAVLAAQEVVQREPGDMTAHSILAVGGLRISTAALAALRGQNSLNSPTRAEAEQMARTLRAILGETVLVPRQAATDSAAPAPKPRSRRRATADTAPASTAKPVAPVTAPAGNPFGALK